MGRYMLPHEPDRQVSVVAADVGHGISGLYHIRNDP
jgi:hypothetical protein